MTDLIGVMFIVIAIAIFIGVANIGYRVYLSNMVCAAASSVMWLFAVVGMVLLMSGNANAANFYAEIGFYHYLTTTDEKILADDSFGGDTYSTIDIGITWYCGEWYCLYADEIDTGLNHLSHPDRGYPINDTEEAYLDGIGAKARWKFWEF